MVKVDTNIYFISTPGIIKYIGCLDKGTEEKWIGISLEEPIGTNDGTHNGHKYFECEGEKFGVFIKEEKFMELVDKNVIKLIGENENYTKEFENKTNFVNPIKNNDEENYCNDLSVEKPSKEKYLGSESAVRENMNYSNIFASKKESLLSPSPNILSNEKSNHSHISSPLKTNQVYPSPNILSNEKSNHSNISSPLKTNQVYPSPNILSNEKSNHSNISSPLKTNQVYPSPNILLNTNIPGKPSRKQYVAENPTIKINTPETVSSPFTIPNKNINLNHINYHKIEHVLYKAKYKKLKQKFTLLNNKFIKNKEKFKEHKNKIDERVLHMVGHIIEANEALDNISNEFNKIMRENNLGNAQKPINLKEKHISLSQCDDPNPRNNLGKFVNTNDFNEKLINLSHCDNSKLENVQKPINLNDTTNTFYSNQSFTQPVSLIKNQNPDEKERLLFLLEKILSGFSLESNSNDIGRYLEEYKNILGKYGIKINI
ncbi:CAP-Gly domain-containing protein [Hamiltosporidium magnivora]|uniref:CAP-Gly domain-containing protein n=2 Tax=Hamiltosporidium magnivora TaxID=148818 RepID=A0A4Q9LA09_9MICR|nr:CAP-Gly domain-containing protein [Hamiltosporidium magnivora]